MGWFPKWKRVVCVVGAGRHSFGGFDLYLGWMEPMLKVPEGRRTRNNVKRALLLGLTILLFMLIFARFGEAAVAITAVFPAVG